MKADPKRPYKAYAATAISFVGTFVAFWIADTGSFTPKEIAAGVLTSAITSGIAGGATFQIRNPKVPN